MALIEPDLKTCHKCNSKRFLEEKSFNVSLRATRRNTHEELPKNNKAYIYICANCYTVMPEDW